MEREKQINGKGTSLFHPILPHKNTEITAGNIN